MCITTNDFILFVINSVTVIIDVHAVEWYFIVSNRVLTGVDGRGFSVPIFVVPPNRRFIIINRPIFDLTDY